MNSNKNLFRLLLVGIILLLLFPLSLPTRADVVKGDANLDGEVTVSDVVAVTNHLHDETPDVFSSEAADVNEDSQLSISDVVGIINLIHYGAYDVSGIVSPSATINDWVDGNGGGEELTQSQDFGD